MKLLHIWMVIGLAVSPQSFAEATDFYVYYLGGQSNMDGYGYVNQLPAAETGVQNDVMIFHGNTSPDKAAVDGKGVWSKLQPGMALDLNQMAKPISIPSGLALS